MTGMVHLDDGMGATGKLVMDGARVLGDATDGHALRIGDADPDIKLFRSYLKGASGSPAVYWDSVTNNNLKASESWFFHGDLGANDPFVGAGGVTPDYAADHCKFNEEPAPATFANQIDVGERFNTYDPDADYDWA
jgi:hypothetical protein